MKTIEKATFAAGCFWNIQEEFDKLEGVIRTTAGYTGGSKEKPTYEEVSSGTTGHVEAVQVEYNPEKLTYNRLLDLFWSIHDPTKANKQGSGGSQYRSVIFYHSKKQQKAALESKKKIKKKYKKPIATEILPATEFYIAEEYHQQYNSKTDRKICGL